VRGIRARLHARYLFPSIIIVDVEIVLATSITIIQSDSYSFVRRAAHSRMVSRTHRAFAYFSPLQIPITSKRGGESHQ